MSFATNRNLFNPKFEGYKLDAVSQEHSVARHNLQYTLTQATASTQSPLSFEEVHSRITHNHIAVAPHGSSAVYIDEQYRVVLIHIDLTTLTPSFRAIYEMSQPIQSKNSAIHREYPSAAFLSSSEIFVSDGAGLLYILRDNGPTSFQLMGTYTLPQPTPFKIHSLETTLSGSAVAVLSSRNYAATTVPKSRGKQIVDFDIWAVAVSLPLASSSSEGITNFEVLWQRRGHAVPIHVAYDESRRVFMVLGDSFYGQVEGPSMPPYSPSAEEMAPIPRTNENLDTISPELSKPLPYSWTQTSDSVTVVLPLPSTTPKASIKVAFAQQSLTVHIQGDIAPDIPLPHYTSKRLWDGISTSSSMWTWDREGDHHVGLLTLHLDKKNEGTRWSHVFASSGLSEEEKDVPETLDASDLWNIRESLEKYTAALRDGDGTGVGLGSDLPSLAMGEMDDDVDQSIGRTAQLTWIGEDGSVPSWASKSTDLPNRVLSTLLPGCGLGISLIVKNGLDGAVFSLEPAVSPAEPPRWIHTSTFSALSFVLASKTDTRFTHHIPSKAVFAFDNGSQGRAGNVYIYRAAPTTEPWAKQAVLRVGQEGSLLGVGAIKMEEGNLILCLTEKAFILINNIQC
ncbi:hypothetical protein B0H15DRAFT_946432 [Mycena belliarum]|uniref:NudC domain-containing protein 1 n=1 Tax=Mycena belliarum TaxID=1033014 RepID=A0AAD6U9E2_9AGAR|nr:hypothetical protein B0H15DRAFT_946432 [Mycena belliae]